MQHPDTETLSSYIDGELRDDEAAQITAHLSTCPQCQREHAELLAVSSLVRNLHAYEPRKPVVFPVRGGARQTSKVISLSRYFKPLAVAAIVIIVAVTGLRVIDELNDSEPSDNDQQAALSPDDDNETKAIDEASESTAGVPELARDASDQQPPMAAMPRQEQPNAAFELAPATSVDSNELHPPGIGAATTIPTPLPGESDESDGGTTGEVVRMVMYVVLGAAIVAGAFWTLYRRIRRDSR